jgi:hypothetical protein
MDVYSGADGGHAVLLWHGRWPEERAVLDPLARLAAGLGVAVFAPDWRSDAPDGGWPTCDGDMGHRACGRPASA